MTEMIILQGRIPEKHTVEWHCLVTDWDAIKAATS